MQTTQSKIQHLWTVIFILVPAFLWVLSSGHPATAGYADSAHGDTSDGVNRSTAACENWPGGVCTTGSCAHCHDTFDPATCGVNEHMLFFFPLDGAGGDEDLCMECHTDTGSVQVGGMSGASGSIVDVFAKTYKHNVLGYSGIHKFWPTSPPADAGDIEDRTYLSANKHIECNDCHNPHLAQAGLHSSNEVHVSSDTNEISDSGPLTGAFGVTPTWQPWNYGGGWNQGGASWPTTSSTADKECEICFKCHTDYNTNYSSWGGSGTTAWTNLALEFNPYKQSSHPVAQPLPEIDPGYEYDSYWDEEYDRHSSSQLPPAFTSVVIGDSGLKTTGSSGSITDSSKSWASNQWTDWGVRFGTRHNMYSDDSHNYVRNVQSNTSNTLTVDYGSTLDLQSNYTVYSIEYYAGRGASKSGNTVTHSIKNFNLYLPSLVGYKVVILEDCTSIFNTIVDWVAVGTVISNTATSFTVDGWTLLYGSSVPSSGNVAYYFSGAGQTMMCSDCHGNDTISSTEAQGPHGSGVKWMLKGRNRAWPTDSASANGTGTGTPYTAFYPAAGSQATRWENDGTPDGLFCLNCHSTVTFSKGGDGLQNEANVHLLHNSPCVNCHVMVPHGSKYSRLIGDQDDPMPARYAFNNDLSNTGVTWYVMKAFDPDHSGRVAGPAAYPQGSHGSYLYCTFNCHW